MTREKAKEFLLNLSYSFGTTAVEYLNEMDGKKMREAIKALEQEYCEDCISRQAVHDMIENAPIKPEDKWFNWMQKLCNRLAELPSVIPQPKIGHCKDCKWWKDSDGSYNRGIGAESQCPMNRIEVFEGTGYCFLYEPHESEE